MAHPLLFPLLWQAYSEPTPLYNGTSEIKSPPGYKWAILPGQWNFHLLPIIPLKVWVLDDGTLGDEISSIRADLERPISALIGIGLEVNSEKCEMIIPKASVKQRSNTLGGVDKIIPRGAGVIRSKTAVT